MSNNIQVIFMDVPEIEYWRFVFCCFICCLPAPKYVRIKNKMALDGWTYERTEPSYKTGYNTLKFWRCQK
jgi:hypothetical protein